MRMPSCDIHHVTPPTQLDRLVYLLRNNPST